MRVLKLGLLSSIALVAFGAAFSAEVSGQDGRLIGGGSGITVFEDRNFRGDAATYQGNMSNLPSKFNNKISSVRIGDGEQWQVCDQANYRGQCVTISGEESDLRQNNWDNRISSLRRLGGGGGWPGNPGGGGSARPPSWAIGTFHSAYPSITMTIANNGQVQSNISGQVYYGRYTNRGIRADGDGSYTTLQRTSNGFRSYNSTSGQTLDFTRNWSGEDGGGGGGNWDGPTSTPPSWAIGTFVSSGDTRMTIDRNGRVTSYSGGQTYYGRYYYGNIHDQNGLVWTITQDRNGFRTTNRSSNQTFNYRRR